MIIVELMGCIAEMKYSQLNEITQTNFTIRISVPNVAVSNGVVRMRYISQNPTENDRGTTFYQCADVKIVKASDEQAASYAASKTSTTTAATAAQSSTVSSASNGTSCCAPAQFTLEGYETASWRNPTAKKFYFDAPNKLLRVDTNSGSGKLFGTWAFLFRRN